MVTEVEELMQQRTWKRIPRHTIPLDKNGDNRRVLKRTWVFKLKRLPDGSPSKLSKARYCVSRDMQREGIDYFNTYAQVVQWFAIRLILTIVLYNGWTTNQVDYTNTFV